MKVSILGTNYTIKKASSGTDPKLISANGYCEHYAKKIVIDEDLYKEASIEEVLDKHKCLNKVIRHELAHAYFEESGLSQYCRDEVLVEWIAKMLPKMIGTCKELEIEE